MTLLRLFALVALIAAPARAQDVDLTDPALIAEGEELFQTICAACHGPTAEDGQSGDIRGSDLRKVRMAVGGLDRMPEQDVTREETLALAAYLAKLGKMD